MEKKKSLKHKESMRERELSYKEKYETLAEKYERIKDIFKQVLKDLKDEKEKQQLIMKQYDKLTKEVKEKDGLLERLQSVSEAVVDEYSTLKVKYELETEAANSAIKRATKYFHENQLLKNKPNTLQEPSNEHLPNDTDVQDIEPEETISELEVLHKVASDLRSEVASLRTQLHKESEKQNALKEDFEIAKNLYEQEMKEHNCTKEKLLSLQSHLGEMTAREFGCLEGENSFEQNFAAESISNDRKLSSDCTDGVDQSTSKRKLVEANRKIEELNSTLEDTIWQHQLEMEELKNKLKEMEELLGFENLAKKLELTEQQMYTYERQNAVLQNRVQDLECQLQRLNAGLLISSPLPPPPPPPPPPSFNPIKSLITFISAGKKASRPSPKKEATVVNQHQKAMTEMIDAIKKGNIQLKPTPKAVPLPAEKDSGGSAVGEMMTILTSLKKKSKPCSPTEPYNPTELVMQDISAVSEELLDRKLSSATDCLMENLPADIEEQDLTDELQVIYREKSLRNSTNDGKFNTFVVVSDEKHGEVSVSALSDISDVNETSGLDNFEQPTCSSDVTRDDRCVTKRVISAKSFFVADVGSTSRHEAVRNSL